MQSATMKSFAFLLITAAIQFPTGSNAQRRDTINLSASNIIHKPIYSGDLSYLVYNKKTRDAPATGLYIANVHIDRITYENQPAIAISQKWEARDTIAHTAYTVLKQSDLSTLLHRTQWMRLPYSTSFDFTAHKVTFQGSVPDSTRDKINDEFNGSFNAYNLNWHSDLFIFSRLPYKENRSFRINFYDPGFGNPREVIYDVTGSEKIATYTDNIDCWVLVLKHGDKDYQKFWVEKKHNIIVKEEDFFAGKYRFKIKLEVSEYQHF